MFDLARLAYDAALRSLDKQEELLSELRARTGVLLAASSLAASFLGRSVASVHPWELEISALVCFAISVGASIYVLLPKTNLVFSLKGSTVFEAVYAFADDMPEAYRRLAYQLDRFWDANDRGLNRLFWAFRAAAIALAGEVILLLVSLSGTLL